MDTTAPTASLQSRQHTAAFNIEINKARDKIGIKYGNDATCLEYHKDMTDMIHHQNIASGREPFETASVSDSASVGDLGRGVVSSSSTNNNLFQHGHQHEYHNSNFAAYSHFHQHHHHYAGSYPVGSSMPVNYYEMGLQELVSGSTNNSRTGSIISRIPRNEASLQKIGETSYSPTGDLMPLAMAAAAAEPHDAALSSFPPKNSNGKRVNSAWKESANKSPALNDASELHGDARKRFLERNRVAGKI